MASAAQKSIKSISYAKYGYMFIAPFFIVYCIFQLWPLINTFRLSFYGNGKTLETFVGLKNFQNILFGSETSIPAQAIHEEFFNYSRTPLSSGWATLFPRSFCLCCWLFGLQMPSLKFPERDFLRLSCICRTSSLQHPYPHCSWFCSGMVNTAQSTPCC